MSTLDIRIDHDVIASWVAEGARVLDLGCGDGSLLAFLARERNVSGYGVEITPAGVRASLANSVNVIQRDLEGGLAGIEDHSFDVVILSQTLQTASRPDYMLDELLRIGRTAFVSFPNFAYWRMRFALLFQGRMPVVRHLPVSWYETQTSEPARLAPILLIPATLERLPAGRPLFAATLSRSPSSSLGIPQHFSFGAI